MQTTNDTTCNNKPNNTIITPSPSLNNLSKRPRRRNFITKKRSGQSYNYNKKKSKHSTQLPISPVELPISPEESPNKKLEYDETTFEDVIISE